MNLDVHVPVVGDVPLDIQEAVDRFFHAHPEFLEGSQLVQAYVGCAILYFKESALWGYLHDTEGHRGVREDFWRMITGSTFTMERRNLISVRFYRTVVMCGVDEPEIISEEEKINIDNPGADAIVES